MKILILVLLSLVSLQMTVTMVGAKEVIPTERTAQKPSPTPTLQGQRKSSPSLRPKCEVVEQRISVTIVRYENNREKHLKRLNHIHEVLQRTINRLDESGKDTTQLEEYLQVLDQKIQKFGNDAQTLIDELKQKQSVVCSESPDAVNQKLGPARSLLQILHEDILDIKNYYKTVIQPALTELKSQNTTDKEL